MIYGVYCIYDCAAGVFTAPTIDISDASAVRSFRQAIANPASIMNFKPDDFVLYQVGSFDVESGKLIPFNPPSRLIAGSDGDCRKEIVDE